MNYLGTDSQLTAVANAIRAKGGTSAQLEWPTGFVSAIEAIPTPSPGPTIVSWASGTDEEIAALIAAAHAGTIDLQQDAGWAIGDSRQISIAAFTGGVEHAAQNINIEISSFDDYESCGCVLQFDFASCLAEAELYGSGKVYNNCTIKTTALPALVNALPNWLKDNLIEFTCVASNNTTTQTITGNKLALRSSIELCDEQYTAPGQGTYMPYYDSSMPNGQNRRKKGIAYGKYVATRSEPKGSGYTSYLHAIDYNGSRQNQEKSANNLYIAPFGCL